jgi:spore maturation protein CgeB
MTATHDLRILFVGENWVGSSARSMREAIETRPAVTVTQIDEDHHSSKYRSVVMRAFGRLREPQRLADLEAAIGLSLRTLSQDVLLVYKGGGVSARVLQHAKQSGALTVNIFPDSSPHAYGSAVRQSMGEYDLVISTKPFHPRHWRQTYGYGNRCTFVPHGYDPAIHCWRSARSHHDLDVVMAATWRREYHQLLKEFAGHTRGTSLRVGVAGSGWIERRRDLPSTWQVIPAVTGRGYGEFLRSGRIALAPVTRDVVIGGVRQPGDEDSTRTYELAAAHCFFLHRRTDYLGAIFDEHTEVPFWDDARELASLVRHYLPREGERRAMAAAAHARAVPEFSIPNRATRVLDAIRAELLAKTLCPPEGCDQQCKADVPHTV